MFQKLKEKIRKWLLEILQQDIDALKNEINESTTELRFAKNNCNEAARQCQISIQQNKEMKKMYNQLTDVAVDVGFHDSEHSWGSCMYCWET